MSVCLHQPATRSHSSMAVSKSQRETHLDDGLSDPQGLLLAHRQVELFALELELDNVSVVYKPVGEHIIIWLQMWFLKPLYRDPIQDDQIIPNSMLLPANSAWFVSKSWSAG
jgi:hypothetical protein